MGPFALAAQLGVPRAEAKEFIAAYFERFPKIRACLDAILEKARATGGTETIFGRVRPIPGLHDRNHAVRSNAERMAMNAPFQGSAADLIKKAMLALDAALAASSPAARLLLQVHDELVLEAPAALAEKAAALARRTMEGAASLSVPLTVDVGTRPQLGRGEVEAEEALESRHAEDPRSPRRGRAGRERRPVRADGGAQARRGAARSRAPRARGGRRTRIRCSSALEEPPKVLERPNPVDLETRVPLALAARVLDTGKVSELVGRRAAAQGARDAASGASPRAGATRFRRRAGARSPRGRRRSSS